MKEFLKLLLCVIVLIIVWNNIDKLIEIGGVFIDVVYDKILSLK